MSNNFKTDFHGKLLNVGATHRFYYIDEDTDDDMAIVVPEGAEYFGILDPENALAYELFTSARDGIEARDSRRELAAADEVPMRPCKPGEFINVSNLDGSSAIGYFTLVFEGGQSLPDGTSNLTITDPGA